MSHPHHNASSSSSNFQIIFNNALKAYEKNTKSDLLTHPLAAQLQGCDSPSTVLLVLQQQVQELNQSRTNNERLTKWLDPTVNVLYSLSGALGEGVGLVFSPAKVIFAGVGVLLLVAKDVRASHETLIDVFESMENFFQRLVVYTEVVPSSEMIDVIMKIMVEVLTILAVTMKEIKQGRTKRFLKKLAGKADIEDALKKLDKLTIEEARMATAQVLKATRNVDARVKAVDDRVAGIADVTRQTADDVNQVKWDQLREGLRRWLSPSDPSTNHNIACSAHHKGSATWFFQGSIFNDWKSTGSLLWIHGKPGSGKSILSSTIIQDIEAICETRQALMGYFYFDFRDAKKQHWRDIVSSLLIQLSARSGPRCDILSRLYSAYDSGAPQPSDDALMKCLREILTLPDGRPCYIIIDAIDECPNTSGIPSPRERVLQFVKDFVDLRLPNLRICVTSRPEIDIRNVLEPLTSCRVSLHDQTGQRKDIEDYIRSVVYSDSEPIVRRWRKEDKDLVIEQLSERADGMWRWVFCQLDVLRHCLPPSVQRTLVELPESLDETYERILKEIKKPNRDHVRRLLQCLVVAMRPLRVEELAEVIAFDFHNAEGLPKLNASWRWEDQEQALLSSCSSLIAIADAEDSRVVQFSHFSVKEFLTSHRLRVDASSGSISFYHIDLEPAHTILAQVCLSVLLQLNGRVNNSTIHQNFPLAQYAAVYWPSHAQFNNVSTRIHSGLESLFDPEKPHFSAWLRLHDIDKSQILMLYPLGNIGASPRGRALYYASLCGLHDFGRRLIVKYPGQVNARGGTYLTPLVAAMSRGHFQMAELLRRSGADPNVRGHAGKAPLHSAASAGNLPMVEELIKHNADVDIKDDFGSTPLRVASETPMGKYLDVVRLLLDHGANVNSRERDGSIPLHGAVRQGRLEVACVLLEHGANVRAVDYQGKTPLQVIPRGHDEMRKLLLEYGAK